MKEEHEGNRTRGRSACSILLAKWTQTEIQICSAFTPHASASLEVTCFSPPPPPPASFVAPYFECVHSYLPSGLGVPPLTHTDGQQPCGLKRILRIILVSCCSGSFILSHPLGGLMYQFVILSCTNLYNSLIQTGSHG